MAVGRLDTSGLDKRREKLHVNMSALILLIQSSFSEGPCEQEVPPPEESPVPEW